MSNSLAKVHPELVSEWAERNFPLTPDDITYGSRRTHKCQTARRLPYAIRKAA